jgi:hypothetical protein
MAMGSHQRNTQRSTCLSTLGPKTERVVMQFLTSAACGVGWDGEGWGKKWSKRSNAPTPILICDATLTSLLLRLHSYVMLRYKHLQTGWGGVDVVATQRRKSHHLGLDNFSKVELAATYQMKVGTLLSFSCLC